MDKLQLDPFAAHLHYSYADTANYSRGFRDEHGIPPTVMAKAHHLRSVLQAEISRDVRYELRSEYMEFGRIHCIDHQGATEFVLRGASALQFEATKVGLEDQPLFDRSWVRSTNSLRLLVNEFKADGLHLSDAPALQRAGRRRFDLDGPVTPLGVWPYTDSTADSPTPFDQGQAYRFREIGGFEVDDVGEGE